MSLDMGYMGYTYEDLSFLIYSGDVLETCADIPSFIGLGLVRRFRLLLSAVGVGAGFGRFLGVVSVVLKKTEGVYKFGFADTLLHVIIISTI